MPSPLAGIARFPRARLGHTPTPLDPAPNLGAALGIDLWIKREDCTGLALGGNKVRQLEFHFGEAQARGADTVLVTGAVQSNLVRIATAGARKHGMAVHIQLEDRIDGMGALYRASGNAPGTGSGVAREAGGCGRRQRGPRLAQDPVPERPQLGPLPRGGGGDQAAALGRLLLAVESGTRVLLSSSRAISMGRPMAAPSPFAAAWTSIE